MKKLVLVCILSIILAGSICPTPAKATLGSGICDIAEYHGWGNPFYNLWCMDSLMEIPGWNDGAGPGGTWW